MKCMHDATVYNGFLSPAHGGLPGYESRWGGSQTLGMIVLES
jgi:hypothetical protein